MLERRKRGSVVVPLLLIFGAGALLGAFFVGRASTNAKNDSLLGTAAKTLAEMFQTDGRRPALEINLGERAAGEGEGASGTAPEQTRDDVIPKKVAQKKSAPTSTRRDNEAVAPKTERADAKSVPKIRACDFSRANSPHHRVVLNEIAWMGTETSPSDEWIELRNNSGERISLRGWQMLSSDGAFKVVFGEKDAVAMGDFFLLERSGDDAVPGVPADKLYSGALANAGEHLRLFDSDCALADEIDASAGWPAGENKTKLTLERNVRDFGWHASVVAGGTPKKRNDDFLPPPTSATNAVANTTLPPIPSSTSSSTTPSSKILISEVMVGIDGTANYEFVEIYNPNDQLVNLFGWELRKRNSSGTESNLVDDRKFIGTIPAHGYFLIGSPAYSGQPAADIIYSVTSANIAYTNNAVLLYNGDYASASLIDQASWMEIPKNQSWERESWESNQFRIQLNPNPRNSSN